MATETLLEEVKGLMADLVADPAPVKEAPYHAAHITSFGHACLCVGFVCMFLSSCYFIKQAMSRSRKDRTFEMLTFFITAIATLAYLVMAAGHGFIRNRTRQPLYYARYVDWLLTTPLMIWDVLELAGVGGYQIFITVTLDALMILSGLVGGLLIRHQVRWGFFLFGMVFFAYVVHDLSVHMSSNKFGSAAQQVYVKVVRLTIVMWTFYPIAWVLTEGTDLLGANSAALLYTILDVISKCVFGIIIVSNRAALDAVYNTKEGYDQVQADGGKL